MNLEDRAKEFIGEKTRNPDMKRGIEWYPRLDVLVRWFTTFADEALKAREIEIADHLEAWSDEEGMAAYIAQLRNGEKS